MRRSVACCEIWTSGTGQRDDQSLCRAGIHTLVKRALAGSLDAADDGSPAPQEALDGFRRHYALENGRNALLYPGVTEGLEALKAKGFPMAVVTNKAEAFTLPLLEMMGWRAISR